MRQGRPSGDPVPLGPGPLADIPENSRPFPWKRLLLVLAAIHYGAVLASVFTGNFDPSPNHDHIRVAEQVLSRGYPTIAVWPPAFGYYIALKLVLGGWLGTPYWTAKLWLDVFPVVASGGLSALLALRLTGSQFLALCSGLGLGAAPIFAMASPEDLAVILFQPLFLGALLLLVEALRRPESEHPGRLLRHLGFGALLGLACLVRANPQFLVFAVAPVVWWSHRRAGFARPLRSAVAALAVALAAQTLVLLPWSLLQRNAAGKSGVFAAPVVYYAYFDGMRRHEGFEVSDALRADPDPPPLSAEGVLELNREWLHRDPIALARLYAAKLVRTWYLSDSGRWDGWIAAAHAPWWLLAVGGAALWWRASRGDPALLLVLVTIAYFWAVSAAVSGLAALLEAWRRLGFSTPSAAASDG